MDVSRSISFQQISPKVLASIYTSTFITEIYVFRKGERRSRNGSEEWRSFHLEAFSAHRYVKVSDKSQTQGNANRARLECTGTVASSAGRRG